MGLIGLLFGASAMFLCVFTLAHHGVWFFPRAWFGETVVFRDMAWNCEMLAQEPLPHPSPKLHFSPRIPLMIFSCNCRWSELSFYCCCLCH